MSDRTPEDYKNALMAVLSITMDDLAGNSPFCTKCGQALPPSESYSDDRTLRVPYAPCDTCRSPEKSP